MVTQANGQWRKVNESMCLKDKHEKRPKMVKDLGEEIPEDTNVW